LAKYNLKRIDVYVPEYTTDAIITIGDDEFTIDYAKGGYKGDKHFAAEIPTDWTDHDLAELISLPIKPRPTRNWPAWEIPARDYGQSSLYRFWKGEKPPEV
jgi:hypothetical protein